MHRRLRFISVLLCSICLVSEVSRAASTPAIEWVQKAYIAYYGRPGDPGGVTYWADRLDDSGGALSSIIEAFGASEEFTDNYGALSNEELIDTIYRQMFNRDPDAEGKAYYIGQLISGTMTLQSITLEILGGAQNEDLSIILNKLTVAAYFTERLEVSGASYESIFDAQDLLSLVDATAASVESVKSQSDALLASWGEGAGPFQFYAVYQKLADNTLIQSIGQGINHSAMSADGKVVAFLTNGGGNPSRIYVCGSDGSNLTYYEPEAQAKNLDGLAINEDGSIIFVMAPYVPAIYKVQNGAVSKINLAVEGGPYGINYPIRTIASGEYAYFRYNGDLWRVHQGGTGMSKIIDDTLVPFNGGFGDTIYEFAISADGGTILFRFWGYWLNGVERALNELFIYRGGTATQITTDAQSKGRLGISQDGSKIVFLKSGEWYSADSAGANLKDLGPGDAYSGQSPAMIYDGSQMFVHDFGGRMIQTDGSGQLDLVGGFPLYLSTYHDPCISKEGKHLLFQSDETNTWGVFYGHLNDIGALSATAPQIHSITFDPAAMVRNNTAARVAMRATMTSPSGVSDLKTVGQYGLINGIADGNSANLPVYFIQPLDNGADFDTVAGDGIFSSSGSPGGKINQYSQMTVRVGVRNTNKNMFTFADTLLSIVNTLPGMTAAVAMESGN